MKQIIGHEAVKEWLQRSIAAGRVAHAYLFVGPPAIGKFALAIAFAQALNCLAAAAMSRSGGAAAQGDVPCGKCRPCRLIPQGKHPDVSFIEMLPEKREISIEQIRALQHEAALKPYEASWKVFILRDAEAMSEEAANCLLKTLEEPPPQVILILTAASTEDLLPTIVSRCQVVPLHPLSLAQVEGALQDRFGCDQERAHLLACLSNGRIGWAIRVVQDGSLLEQRNQLLARLISLAKASRRERLAFAAELAQRYTKDAAERQDVHAILDAWGLWWRDVILVRAGCPELVTNVDRLEILQAEAKHYPLMQARAFLDALAQVGQQLRQNVNPRLALEVLALMVPRGG